MRDGRLGTQDPFIEGFGFLYGNGTVDGSEFRNQKSGELSPVEGGKLVVEIPLIIKTTGFISIPRVKAGFLPIVL